MALPVWALFMKKVQNDRRLNMSKDDVFEKPEHFNVSFDCDTAIDENATEGERVGQPDENNNIF